MTFKPGFRTALAAVSFVTLAWPRLGWAKDVQPQNNEVTFDADATFAKHGDNDADVELVYTWLPQAIDKNDEVVAPLRRFVRRPIELGARLGRVNDTTDTVTGLYGVATGWLGGIGYGKIDGGFEYDQVQNDAPHGEENAFIAGNVRVEAGARVLPLLQLGGFYRYRPVLATLPVPDGLAGYVQERSGHTQELGASLAFATPADRVLFQVALGFRNTDWTFTGNNYPGKVTGRAPIGDARLSVQLSPDVSFYIHAAFSSTDWNNQRMDQTTRTMRAAEITRPDLRGEVGYVYWFEGKWAFRVSLGGGYYGKGPLFYQDYQSPLVRLGIGFTTRY